MGVGTDAGHGENRLNCRGENPRKRLPETTVFAQANTWLNSSTSSSLFGRKLFCLPQ
jgi:hypothetical protein